MKHITQFLSHPSLEVSVAQMERCTRRFKRRIKAMERRQHNQPECCLHGIEILERQDRLERLLEVIAMELKRQADQKEQNA